MKLTAEASECNIISFHAILYESKMIKKVLFSVRNSEEEAEVRSVASGMELRDERCGAISYLKA